MVIFIVFLNLNNNNLDLKRILIEAENCEEEDLKSSVAELKKIYKII